MLVVLKEQKFFYKIVSYQDYFKLIKNMFFSKNKWLVPIIDSAISEWSCWSVLALSDSAFFFFLITGSKTQTSVLCGKSISTKLQNYICPSCLSIPLNFLSSTKVSFPCSRFSLWFWVARNTEGVFSVETEGNKILSTSVFFVSIVTRAPAPFSSNPTFCLVFLFGLNLFFFPFTSLVKFN